MSHILTIELPDEMYVPLAQAAAQTGQTPEEWAVDRLRLCVRPVGDYSSALTRLMRHAGAVDLGRPSGVDNEQIDADLTREYGSSHEKAG